MYVAVYFWLFIVMSYVAQLATTGRTYVCCGIEGFNDWGGRGYDDFVPGEVIKTAPSEDETT